MNPCWGSSDVFSLQLAPKFAWSRRKGLRGCLIATGLHWLVTTRKEDAWVVLFLWGVRLSAEGQGAAFHFFTSHLGASVVLVWFVLVGVGVFFGVCFAWIAPGFFARQLPGANRANRASFSSNHRRLDDRQSLERARRELKISRL